jgi:methionine--tRNA ligase beta chain
MEATMITFDDFLKLDLKTGVVKEATSHPDADKLLLLKVDIGDKEIQIVAGIKSSYTGDELIGKQIAVLTNLEARKIRGELSEGMLLAAQGTNCLSVLTLDKSVEPGSKIR